MSTATAENAATAGSPTPADMGAFERAFVRLMQRPKLSRGLALIAALLCAPTLWLPFYLDDYVGRYIYSNLPGARKLLQIYMGGYGLANGVPADNHYQVEAGYAPWWIYDHLRLGLFRPIPMLTHMFEYGLFPDTAWPMHLQNLLWLGLLVLAVARFYRSVMPAAAAGLAALLFAVDHTHAFVVGYIENRYALMCVLFGVLALELHVRARERAARTRLWALGSYAIALLCGESAISVAGYLFGYALFCERGSLLARMRTIAPYAVLTVVWRAGYNLAGFGAIGCGPYIDPAHEPLRFVRVFAERAPILWLGQFFAPPAEFYTVAPPAVQQLLLAVGVAAFALLLLVLLPLLRRQPLARALFLGALLSLVPASGTYPHNRQLLFTSVGALALLAQLWHLYAIERRGIAVPRLEALTSRVGALVLGGHLLLSPLALPFMSRGIAFLAPVQRAGEHIGDETAGKDLVFLTAPDYFSVKVVQLRMRVEHRPLPRRFRVLSFGPQRVIVQRKDARTLELEYEGGILSSPFMELYRDRRLPMKAGERVELLGLSIEVLAVTPDGRAERVRFAFDTPLDAPSFRFYVFDGSRFADFVPPPLGGQATLPAAAIKWEL